MSEKQKQELLEAAEQAMATAHAQAPAEKVADLKRMGILDEEGLLSERYGGPGKMTWPSDWDGRSGAS